jgi:hypothetical protein
MYFYSHTTTEAEIFSKAIKKWASEALVWSEPYSKKMNDIGGEEECTAKFQEHRFPTSVRFWQSCGRSVKTMQTMQTS